MAKLTKAEAAKLNGKKGGRPRKSRELPAPAVVAIVTAAESTQAAEPETPTTVDNPFGLTPKELLFLEAYCGVANFNAGQAYKLAGFSGSARELGPRLLKNDRVRAALAAKMAPRLERLQVADDDEVLRRVTCRSRADIGKVLGANDRIAQLPDDVRLTIKAVRETAYGRSIELYDTHREDELLLKVSGKLTQKHEVRLTRSLEDILAEVGALEQAQVPA